MVFRIVDKGSCKLSRKPYILGDRPYKRFIKGPCLITGHPADIYQDLLSIAGPNDVIDTKGIRNRKSYWVIYRTGANEGN